MNLHKCCFFLKKKILIKDIKQFFNSLPQLCYHRIPLWNCRREILTSGGHCRCFESCPRPAVGMFSHRMKRQGRQLHWFSPLGHVTRVKWLKRTWPVGLADDRRRGGHLNRADTCGTLDADLRDGDCQPHQMPGDSHSLRGILKLLGRRFAMADRLRSRRGAQLHPRLCTDSLLLCGVATHTFKALFCFSTAVLDQTEQK